MTLVIVVFDVLRVPNKGVYGAATLVLCSLYPKNIDTCYQSGRLAKPKDGYPNPPTPFGGLRPRRPEPGPPVYPQCLCGQARLTADRAC
ncbi:hypothetical protein HPB48_006629 [Haemaphysalis longicornis]|uniref:Uncharacterized protein n=1 Tax=Haemaphysalis longicornis TaxID=44386 RepID=A0A9J6GKT4_HAELO|nr:hypothetical protein HPB48_006629 [Haemaphysalis longicornis]